MKGGIPNERIPHLRKPFYTIEEPGTKTYYRGQE